MSNKIKDAELNQYADQIGHRKYREQYQHLYQKAMQSGNKRYSGRHYENDQQKLLQIKQKYKSGVTLQMINRMLEELK